MRKKIQEDRIMQKHLKIYLPVLIVARTDYLIEFVQLVDIMATN
jgi:hypothetical protein